MTFTDYLRLLGWILVFLFPLVVVYLTGGPDKEPLLDDVEYQARQRKQKQQQQKREVNNNNKKQQQPAVEQVEASPKKTNKKKANKKKKSSTATADDAEVATAISTAVEVNQTLAEKPKNKKKKSAKKSPPATTTTTTPTVIVSEEPKTEQKQPSTKQVSKKKGEKEESVAVSSSSQQEEEEEKKPLLAEKKDVDSDREEKVKEIDEHMDPTAHYARVLRIKPEEEEDEWEAVPAEDGWSQVKTRRNNNNGSRSSSSTYIDTNAAINEEEGIRSIPGLDKKQRENLARNLKKKQQKAKADALQAERLRKHQKELEKLKIQEFYSSGKGKNTPWGASGKRSSSKVPTSTAGINEHGQLIWD